MDAPSHNSMLDSADFMSHDEFLACRHAQRAPRTSSLEAKPTSSFFPVDHVSHDAFPRDSSVPTSAPPSASHDEFLARRHAERAPRVCSREEKLTSSLDDCFSVPTSPPPRVSPASHLRSTNQRTRSLPREASWLTRPKDTAAGLGASIHRMCSV
jgi:hypothetical protein